MACSLACEENYQGSHGRYLLLVSKRKYYSILYDDRDFLLSGELLVYCR